MIEGFKLCTLSLSFFILLEIAQQLNRVALDASYLTCTIFKTVFHNS